ncbi:MAG: glycosyltransferase family 2 protein, partial [Candidatus Omnitrophica bacterium]|nr:glycosyltransferase family 2 protein [Candidatus Omnitrophota bacterium]
MTKFSFDPQPSTLNKSFQTVAHAQKIINDKSGTKKILIIIPAYNEEGNILKTVREICDYNSSLSVVVVNDGSQDNTREEAEASGAYVINLPLNLGIGGAVQTGFKFAKEYNFDIAVQIDGDGQHDVRFLNNIVDPVINDEVDMAIGSRFLPPYLGYRSSFIRRIGIHFFAYLISFLTQYKITDPTSGFRAFNRRMIDVFANYYPQDFPEPEAIVVAARHRARVVEFPVQMRKRAAGNSSIRYLKTLYYMIKVTIAVVLGRLKRK